MNPASPLIPQGALDRQSKGKSTVRIAIFTIISIHAVFFAGLLMQGCRQDEAPPAAQTAGLSTNQNTYPPLPDYYPSPEEIPPQALISAPMETTTTTPPANVAPAAYSDFTPPPSAPTPATSIETKTYTVRKHDTLEKIARAHGVTISALTDANPHVDARRLKLGSTLLIPASTAPVSSSGFTEATPSDLATGSDVIHSVRRGETLTRIAKQYGTTVKALRAANNLKSDLLRIGQKLRVPESAHKTAGDLSRLSMNGGSM